MKAKVLPLLSSLFIVSILSSSTRLPSADPTEAAWFSVSPYRTDRSLAVTIDFLPGTEIQGWSFGLAHDTRAASILSFGPTSDLLTIRGGGEPDFLVCEEAVGGADPYKAGIVQACVLSEVRPFVLPERAGGFPVLDVEYSVKTETTAEVVSGLRGSGEPVASIFTINSASHVPAFPASAHLVPKIYDAWVTLSPGTSEGPVTMSLFYDPAVSIEGWTLAVLHGLHEAWIGSFEMPPELAALNGGLGPEYYSCERLDGVEDFAGLVQSVILSSDGSETLPPLDGIPFPILEIDYKVLAPCTVTIGDVTTESGKIPSTLTIEGQPYSPKPLPVSKLFPKVPEIWVELTPATSDGLVTAAIDFKNAEIQGWSLGLCHDPSAASIESYEIAPELLALCHGKEPDFYICEPAEDGPTAGIVQAAVLSFSKYSMLPPTEGGFPVLQVRYRIQSESTVSLCGGLRGSGESVPVVFTSISRSFGTSRPAEARLVQKPYSKQLAYRVEPPLSGEVVTVKLSTGELPIEGWSFALCNTARSAEVRELAVSAEVAGILDGEPPEFLTTEVTIAAPYTVVKQSAVLGNFLSPISMGPYPAGLPLLRVRYAVFEEDDLKFCDMVGSLTFDNRVTVDGVKYLPATRQGARLAMGALGTRFIRGDADLSGHVDLTDSIVILSHLFLGSGPLPCRDAADANDVGPIDITDPIFILQFLFLGGPQPPLPFPQPGEDMTPRKDLGCVRGL